MIAIIDYKAGNLTSVKLAFDALSEHAVITSDPGDIKVADRIVFPGVGAAENAMKNISELKLKPAIKEALKSGKPFLGICLGTQILLDFSEEDGGTECLGLIPGAVKLFKPADFFDKVPQMGWNTVNYRKVHPVLKNIDNDTEFYFVHSYYCQTKTDNEYLASTSYGGVKFASIIGKDNLIATQFHPERSGKIGLRLLKNFVKWDGKC